MTPPLQDCLKNPPVKDEVWDKCVRRSSIGIGIGGLLGAVSSVFLGAGGVFLSMGLCVTWAVKHCRTLFREQAKAKMELQALPPCPKPALPVEEPHICEKEIEPVMPVCDPLPIEEPPCPSYTFPPVFPIPDRPFGRAKKDKREDSDECSCVIVEKCDEDADSYKIECTCPVPIVEGDECKSEEIPDFSIECTSPEEPSSTSPPPEEPIEEPICTCPKIEEPICTCPTPEPEHTKPSEPECTCDRDECT